MATVKMELSDVKSRIRRLMQREDISIDSMAEVGGVSKSTVRRWCNPSDDTDIGLHAFGEIAYHFTISLDALMFPRGNPAVDGHKEIHRIWRANMDWWEVHLSTDQKEAILATIKAVWQVSSETTAKQLHITGSLPGTEDETERSS
jgi:transcriptional regulator with XRE-family HTH domain